jgi:hypothetical protein
VFGAWLVSTCIAAGLYLAGEPEGARVAGASAATLLAVLVDVVRAASRLGRDDDGG